MLKHERSLNEAFWRSNMCESRCYCYCCLWTKLVVVHFSAVASLVLVIFFSRIAFVEKKKSNGYKLVWNVKLLLFTNLCGIFSGNSVDATMCAMVWEQAENRAECVYAFEQWPNHWFKLKYMWSVGIRIYYLDSNMWTSLWTELFFFLLSDCLVCDGGYNHRQDHWN